jgi:hypothetical protein
MLRWADFYEKEIWKEKRLTLGISFLEIANRNSDSVIDRQTEMIPALPGTHCSDLKGTPVIKSDFEIKFLQEYSSTNMRERLAK